MDDPESPLVNSGTDLDFWRGSGGIVGQGRSCCYCGSMNPDDFMEAVRTGCLIGPTDKNYKAYVQGWPGNGPNGGKFYFQHLSDDQKGEFVRLLNAKGINIDYPGRFYAAPFFVSYAPA